MSTGELLLTLLVALLVFGPDKLPMLARHLGKLMNRLNHYKQQATTFWQAQLNEEQLQQNIRKAQQAESEYQKKATNEDRSD